MVVPLHGSGDFEEPAPSMAPSSTTASRGQRWRVPLPSAVAAALWRGSDLGSSVNSVLPTGFDRLDAELPGGGWPCQSLTEILQVQASVCEWRLLAPAMCRIAAAGKDVVVVGPPKTPHLPGLRHLGLDEKRLVWIRADTPAERLWTTEQLVKANAAGLVVAWLPQARQEQIRRLQVCAQSCDGPVFLCRPASAEHEASAAPLRVQLRFDVDWALHIHLLKRKGAPHEGTIELASMPGGLDRVITPRLRQPSRLIAARRERELNEPHVNEDRHVVGSAPSRQPSAARSAATH